MSNKKVAVRQLTRYQDYNTVFSTPAGKRVLLDLMNKYFILSPLYKGDVNEMLISEGSRKVVLDLLSILKVDVNELKERVDRYVNEQED